MYSSFNSIFTKYNIANAISENNTTIINKVDQNIEAKIANTNTEIN